MKNWKIEKFKIKNSFDLFFKKRRQIDKQTDRETETGDQFSLPSGSKKNEEHAHSKITNH